jgi:hypothetical protein
LVPRFKHFRGFGAEFEQTINRWLDDFEPDITQMSQTVDSSGSLTVSFVYEESFRGQEMRLDSEHGMSAATKPVSPEAVMPQDHVDVRLTAPERGPEPNTGAS